MNKFLRYSGINSGWLGSLLLLGMFFICSEVNAATFYMSPNGSDYNPGTSDSPFKTFGFALKQLLPGDTLILKNGTYTKSTTGLPNINCGSGVRNGSSTMPITIKAENERQAFLSSDGSVDAFKMNYCSYWNIEGLRGGAADLKNVVTAGFGFNILNSSFLNLRRLLAHNPNRYSNSHPISVNWSNNVLVEECEAYNYHRWGITSYISPQVTFRRNYANSRNTPDLCQISGGQCVAKDNGSACTGCSVYPTTGDFGVAIYGSPGSYNNILENNISENNGDGFTPGSTESNQTNRFFGNISYRDRRGFSIGWGLRTNNILLENNALIYNIVGIYTICGLNHQWINNTVYNATNQGYLSYVVGSVCSTSPTATTYITNGLSFGNGFGFYMANQSNMLCDYVNAALNGTNFYSTPTESVSDNAGNIRNSRSVAPTGMGLGADQCLVYVPSNSNMKRAGKNGADIGANIVYRYQYGVLTDQKLWNQTTGQFPCGAIVAGVNDIAGNSCFDVNKRLNVGANGCPIP